MDIPRLVFYLQYMAPTYQQQAAANVTRLITTRPINKAILASEIGIGEATLRKRLRDGDFRLSELLAVARIFRVSVTDILTAQATA